MSMQKAQWYRVNVIQVTSPERSAIVTRMMNIASLLVRVGLCLALSLMPGLTRAAPPSANVAWQDSSAPGALDQAFAAAKSQRKPVLLYWGAAWCPPCNQLKKTVFQTERFAQLAQGFVAVHVDGDQPGAQALGQRFRVRGYPTVVVFSAEGEELFRMPSGGTPEQILQALGSGLGDGRSIQSTLTAALEGRPVSPAGWRMLALYAWSQDGLTFLTESEVGPTVSKLALAAQKAQGVSAEMRHRMLLKAVATGSRDPLVIRSAREVLTQILASAPRVRQHADAILSDGALLAEVLLANPSAMRKAMEGLQQRGGLSRPDQAGLLVERVRLERIGVPKDQHFPSLPKPFLQRLSAEVGQLASAPMDGYERQAVIPSLGYALGLAGLWAESDRLLRDGLAKSHSDYYLMSQLGSNARKQGKTQEALQWYQQSYEKSVGPATRLQWGVGYLTALTELAPDEARRIELLAMALIREAAQDPAAFEERSGRSMQRLARSLAEWNKMNSQTSSIRAIQASLEGVCQRMDMADRQRSVCSGVVDRLK